MQTSNCYSHKFTAICPVNGEAILYDIEIQSADVIMVEEITAFFRGLKDPVFHEALADQLYAAFGGFQIMVATHHGVDIRTERYA